MLTIESSNQIFYTKNTYSKILKKKQMSQRYCFLNMKNSHTKTYYKAIIIKTKSNKCLNGQTGGTNYKVQK